MGTAEWHDRKHYRIRELFTYPDVNLENKTIPTTKIICFNHWQHRSETQKDNRQNRKESHTQEKVVSAFSLGNTNYMKNRILTSSGRLKYELWVCTESKKFLKLFYRVSFRRKQSVQQNHHGIWTGGNKDNDSEKAQRLKTQFMWQRESIFLITCD